MAFKSPPPHKRSSGSNGGKNEIDRIARDLQITIKRLGYDKIPLNDEKWRPLMAMLWGFTEARGTRPYIFDKAPDYGRLRVGVVSDNAIELKKLAMDFQEALLKAFTLEFVQEAKPTFAIGRTSMFYFENIWTPLEALDGRKN